MAVDEMWLEIDSRWNEIRKVLEEKLPTDEYVMLNCHGKWCKSNRPMIESIIADWTARLTSFVYYLVAAGIVKMDKGSVEYIHKPDGTKEIVVNVHSNMPIHSGKTTGLVQERLENSL